MSWAPCWEASGLVSDSQWEVFEGYLFILGCAFPQPWLLPQYRGHLQSPGARTLGTEGTGPRINPSGCRTHLSTATAIHGVLQGSCFPSVQIWLHEDSGPGPRPCPCVESYLSYHRTVRSLSRSKDNYTVAFLRALK